MLVSIPPSQFPAFRAQKQRFDRTHTAKATAVFRAIFGSESIHFCVHKQCVLSFVLAATYASGREAAQIYHYQFERGIVQKSTGIVVCGALAMSEKTIRKHINELSEDGWLTIYAAREEESKAESEARIFEIDCKKLLKGTDGLEVGGGKVAGGGVVKETPHHRTYKEIAKAIFPADGGVVGEAVNQRNVVMLKTPKRGYWQSPSNDAPATVVIQQIQAATIQRSERVAASVAVKPPHQWKKDEMQSVLDSLMKLYQPNTPRILVTNREHGFFVKRLREQPVQDLRAFLSWALRYWDDIATQSRKAIQRRAEIGNTKAGSPLPMAPSFSSIVYRYPYLLKAYASFVAERRAEPKEKEVVDSRVRALEAQVKRLESDRQTLRKAVAQSKVAPSSTRARIARSAPVQSVAFDDDLPEWDAPTTGENNAKRA